MILPDFKRILAFLEIFLLKFFNIKFKKKNLPVGACYMWTDGQTDIANIRFSLFMRTRLPWSLTLREERRLRVFENRVLRRVFGPKRDEVTG